MTGQDAILAFLKAIKADTSQFKELLTSDDAGDFDAQGAAQEYLESRKQAFADGMQGDVQEKIDKALKEAEAEQYNRITQPLIKKMIREAGLEVEKDSPIKDVFDAFVAKVKADTKEGDEALRAKYDNLKSEYSQLLDKNEELQGQVKTVLTEKEEFEKKTENRIKVNSLLTSTLDQMDWAMSGARLDREKGNLRRDIDESFIVNADGTFVHRDKETPVMRPDDGGRYHHIKEWIIDQGNEYALFKKSNGKEEVNLDGAHKKFVEGAEDKQKAAQKVKQVKERIREKAKELGLSEADIPEGH